MSNESAARWRDRPRSEEHTSELQSRENLVCRLLLEKKKKNSHEIRTLAVAVSLCLRIYAVSSLYVFFFFFNDTATTEIYTLSLHDALPISASASRRSPGTPCATASARS